MARRRSVWWFSFALAGLLSFAAGPARSEPPPLAISGYDPVAYFTDHKPVLGDNKFEYQWHNLRWRFASLAHRDQFEHDPGHYAPQYDGYCAAGVESPTPHKDTVDPNTWAIVDGKLYLTHNRHALDVWREHTADNIKHGDANWPNVQKQSVLYDGYPHVLETPQNTPAAPSTAAPAPHG